LPCFTRTWQAVSILLMSILLLLLLETMCVARLPRRTHKISLNYDNTKPDLFYNREFAATADRSQLGRWSERCGQHEDTSHTPYRHHSCFLDACMSKVRTWMVSVGIEAAVRPICGKGKTRADKRKTFPLLLFY
jgi:hypothetical protein